VPTLTEKKRKKGKRGGQKTGGGGERELISNLLLQLSLEPRGKRGEENEGEGSIYPLFSMRDFPEVVSSSMEKEGEGKKRGGSCIASLISIL